jgi:tungstate transport system substrate-binding protein
MSRLCVAIAILCALLIVACAAPAAAPTVAPTAAPTVATTAPTAAPAAAPAAAPTAAPPKLANPDLILSTTTSTQDSGLLDVLIPLFEKHAGYKVKTIAVGSGASMTMGERGEADVLLVHAPDSEVKFVAGGHGINRQLVMHNDFIIIGPSADPAKIKGAKIVKDAFQKLAAAKALFISRGDNSGTHQQELKIWKNASVDPTKESWYQQSGQGMGATLNIATEKAAYTISDRATYLANKSKLALDVLVEGDKDLLNIYHVMQVNPNKSAKINATGAKAFVDFIIAKDTQDIIGKFGVDKYGQALFFADAGKDESKLGQ